MSDDNEFNSRFGDQREEAPPLEFNGVIHASTAKAYKFEADNWSEPAWIPKSQSLIVELDEETKRATIRIKAWLCTKNGWREL